MRGQRLQQLVGAVGAVVGIDENIGEAEQMVPGHPFQHIGPLILGHGDDRHPAMARAVCAARHPSAAPRDRLQRIGGRGQKAAFGAPGAKPALARRQAVREAGAGLAQPARIKVHAVAPRRGDPRAQLRRARRVYQRLPVAERDREEALLWLRLRDLAGFAGEMGQRARAERPPGHLLHRHRLPRLRGLPQRGPAARGQPGWDRGRIGQEPVQLGQRPRFGRQAKHRGAELGLVHPLVADVPAELAPEGAQRQNICIDPDPPGLAHHHRAEDIGVQRRAAGFRVPQDAGAIPDLARVAQRGAHRQVRHRAICIKHIIMPQIQKAPDRGDFQPAERSVDPERADRHPLATHALIHPRSGAPMGADYGRGRFAVKQTAGRESASAAAPGPDDARIRPESAQNRRNSAPPAASTHRNGHFCSLTGPQG